MNFLKGVRGSSNYPDWNNTMYIFKILKVIPLADKKLSVLFIMAKQKRMIVKQLLKKPAFSLLKEEPFFNRLRLKSVGMEFLGMTMLILANTNCGQTEWKLILRTHPCLIDNIPWRSIFRRMERSFQPY